MDAVGRDGAVVIGDAFVDVLVPVGRTLPGETHQRSIRISCGGTANVAVRLSKIGGRSAFAGIVGGDPMGAYFRDELERSGVKDLTTIDDTDPTGICVSLLHENGERTLIASGGANDRLDDRLVEIAREEIAGARIVYLTGYSLHRNRETLARAMEASQNCGCAIYFNPGAPNLINDDVRKLVRDHVDALILNLDEARNLTQETDIPSITRELSGYATTCVMTRGSEGCMVSTDDGWKHIGAEPLDILDSTGAGDSFSAGFIYGKLQGMGDAESAAVGMDVAGRYLKEKNNIKQPVNNFQG